MADTPALPTALAPILEQSHSNEYAVRRVTRSLDAARKTLARTQKAHDRHKVGTYQLIRAERKVKDLESYLAALTFVPDDASPSFPTVNATVIFAAQAFSKAHPRARVCYMWLSPAYYDSWQEASYAATGSAKFKVGKVEVRVYPSRSQAVDELLYAGADRYLAGKAMLPPAFMSHDAESMSLFQSLCASGLSPTDAACAVRDSITP